MRYLMLLKANQPATPPPQPVPVPENPLPEDSEQMSAPATRQKSALPSAVFMARAPRPARSDRRRR